jgi:hypothetical protein
LQPTHHRQQQRSGTARASHKRPETAPMSRKCVEQLLKFRAPPSFGMTVFHRQVAMVPHDRNEDTVVQQDFDLKFNNR